MSFFDIFKFTNKNGKKENENYEDSIIKDKVELKNFNGRITLLVIADTHGELAYNKKLQNYIKDKEYDLCCMLGDIPSGDIKIILENIPKEKIVAILGNHDGLDLLDIYDLTNLNGKVIELNGIKFGGIQGSFKYKDEKFPSFTHEESMEFLNSLGPVDILLSHDKPFTLSRHDSVHDGLKGITKYLYINGIPINIHGHVHYSYEERLKNGSLEKSVYLCELLRIENGVLKNI